MSKQDERQFESDAMLAAEVERLESWFAEFAAQYPEPPCRVMEQVKMATELVVSERCMSAAVGDVSMISMATTAPPSSETMNATKAVVRRELMAMAGAKNNSKNNGKDNRNVPTGNAFKWGSLLAMASAAVIALVILPKSPDPDTPKNIADVSAIDDWAYVLTESNESELDSDLSGFKSDLNEFGDSLVSLDDFADELGTDEIEDAIDQLYSDSASFLDS
ncbi:MAG TPA: hypothetical protein PKN33_07275 [Phycisphaerae bacterium]|nr:hypothetical protein [Phycisphaerae bacterium]